jgi:hypothetical protein
MKRILLPFIALPALLLAPSTSSAADHYDMFESKDVIGSQEERHHDIVDLFTFPSPDKSGKLVMIMNTHNRAHADSAFLDTIHYSFRLRTGAVRERGAEYRFTCTFDAAAVQTATCTTYRVENGTATPVKGGSTVVKFGAKDGGANPKLRAFAGLRADAFFGDAVGLLVMVKTHTLPFGPIGLLPDSLRNLTYNTNDLSIVLEVDMKGLLGEDGSIFRVAAETAKKKGT